MTTLKNKRKILNEFLPLLKNFRYGSCCLNVRTKHLIKGLGELFEMLDIGYNKTKLLSKPNKYYTALRKIILADSTLSASEKVNYEKIMLE